MRLRAAVAATMLLAVGSMAPAGAARELASAGEQRPRRAMLPYSLQDNNHHFTVPPAHAGSWEQEDAYDFPLRKGESAVSVMVLDDREGPVAAVIVQWTTDFESGGASVGHALTYHPFCTETDAPVPVVPDVTVQIMLEKGTCEDGSPSLPTSGDIVVDFHRR